MRQIDPREISGNIIRMMGDRWMLVTAGTPDNFNMMTASWGGIGYLWNEPVAFVFVRPQRYTYEFTEVQESMTLSFFNDQYRTSLTTCGTTSGRDIDKVSRSELTPLTLDSGNVAFEEADLILDCRKEYGDMLRPDAFVNPTLIKEWYPAMDFHKMYVVKIVSVWKKV